jgi:hypothetical protein
VLPPNRQPERVARLPQELRGPKEEQVQTPHVTSPFFTAPLWSKGRKNYRASKDNEQLAANYRSKLAAPSQAEGMHAESEAAYL